MPDRTARRRPVLALLVGAALLSVTACTARADDAPEPSSVASTSPTPAASASPSPTTTPSTTPPPLIPPSVIASAEVPAPPVYDDPPVEVPTQQPTQAPPQPVPEEPTTPAPSPVDSNGFPLGTTCGAVSCTSPDGVIFVNPDAVPNFGAQPFDLLCGQTLCPPPGLQLTPELPSSGSAG
ncbi:hypothetical protein [Rhodococcoides kyotonense]|uniref:Uncharacterized protein n=1 Tax=Rhodococcoides kyotonense TaxID=398843 RepID=A0A239LI49_9NOCA|nr:hypothetical protein [Rhodococcus kyotonensis]SNT30266.1 hypothetical protein SAMN05421642_11384 [Rhodococcus kyotonensis]